MADDEFATLNPTTMFLRQQFSHISSRCEAPKPHLTVYVQFHWLMIAGQESDSREEPGCIAKVRFILAVADGEGNCVVGLQCDLV